MEKIKCKKCGRVHYSASPEAVRCEFCGGGYEVMEREVKKVKEAVFFEALLPYIGGAAIGRIFFLV